MTSDDVDVARAANDSATGTAAATGLVREESCTGKDRGLARRIVPVRAKGHNTADECALLPLPVRRAREAERYRHRALPTDSLDLLVKPASPRSCHAPPR